MGAGYKFSARAADKSAEILIYEDVGADWFGGVTALQVRDDLKAAGKVSQIDVRIASYGGDVNDGMAIYRTLAEHDAHVTVHIDGMAASIASVIAMAGDEIIIAESGSIMIHEAWTIAAGNAKKLRAVADNADNLSRQMRDIYSARTKAAGNQVDEWMAAETWFYGSEAVDAGFADKVAPNVKMAASAAGRSLWAGAMHGRIAQRMHMAAPDRAAPNAADHNAAVRAQLQQMADRVRAKRRV